MMWFISLKSIRPDDFHFAEHCGGCARDCCRSVSMSDRSVYERCYRRVLGDFRCVYYCDGIILSTGVGFLVRFLRALDWSWIVVLLSRLSDHRTAEFQMGQFRLLGWRCDNRSWHSVFHIRLSAIHSKTNSSER